MSEKIPAATLKSLIPRIEGIVVPPSFFVSVASKGVRTHVRGLESTLTDICVSVDSKGVAPPNTVRASAQ
jgi:hypothetical protein